MILWTIVPIDQLSTNVENLPIYEETQCDNVTLLVERIGATQCRIIRLLTTNPEDYLRCEFQPGEIITYKPSM